MRTPRRGVVHRARRSSRRGQYRARWALTVYGARSHTATGIQRSIACYPAGASYFNVSRGLLDASPSSGGGGTTLSRRGALPIASRWRDSSGSVCGGRAPSDLKKLFQDTGSPFYVWFSHALINMVSHG